MRNRITFTLAILFLGFAFVRSEPPVSPPKPKLAVLIVFDQMRGDYVEKWRELFVADGFRRLQTEGAWFTDCHYPYATTQTGPGHASLLSGCSADRHGIVANNWYDRKEGATVYCAAYPRYERVPPAPPKADVKPAATPPSGDAKIFEEDPKPVGYGAPTRMLAPTLGDTLKEATNGQGKVFGLSLKDRSAILPAGKKPDGCFWFDKGQFVTSTYYNDHLAPWVTRFNEEKSFDRWFGQKWEKLNPLLDYEKYSGPDDVIGEDKGSNQGRAFPHPMGTATKIGTEYYSALANSPFGNQVLLDFACRCIDEEQLGKHAVPDLLIVSFSSNDLIGHAWGPDSQEVLDVTLRSDLIVRDLLKYLDEHVGKGNYVVALSADHGICPLPEVSRSRGIAAERISPRTLMTAIDQHLQQTYGDPAKQNNGDQPAKQTDSESGKSKQSENEKPSDKQSRWIEIANDGGIYLNQRLLQAAKLNADDVASELAKWLPTQSPVQAAYSRSQLLAEIPVSDEIGRRVQKSFHPDRSGDAIIVVKPYFLLGSRKTGTNHGTPHPYDTHVPLMIFGPSIKAGTRADHVTPQATAAIFARALGIAAPAKAESPVPDRLFD